ncbi:MAG: molybdopterin adenylyltransferase [Candidatus Firestonebacteria bacterium]
MLKLKVGIITISDRSFRGIYKDESGPILVELVKESSAEVVKYEIIPDDKKVIVDKLMTYVDYLKLDLILTNGGTGLSERDITPEAVREVIQKEVPGIGEYIRFKSLEKTPNAILSRTVAGVRNNSLIISFPGSPKAVKECWEIISPVLNHAIGIIKGEKLDDKKEIKC